MQGHQNNPNANMRGQAHEFERCKFYFFNKFNFQSVGQNKMNWGIGLGNQFDFRGLDFGNVFANKHCWFNFSWKIQIERT